MDIIRIFNLKEVVNMHNIDMHNTYFPLCTITAIFNVKRTIHKGHTETVKPARLPFIDYDGVEFNGPIGPLRGIEMDIIQIFI